MAPEDFGAAADSCIVCQFYHPSGDEPEAGADPRHTAYRLGECRHDPPRLIQFEPVPVMVGSADRIQTMWPAVCVGDWCGSFKRRDR